MAWWSFLQEWAADCRLIPARLLKQLQSVKLDGPAVPSNSFLRRVCVCGVGGGGGAAHFGMLPSIAALGMGLFGFQTIDAVTRECQIALQSMIKAHSFQSALLSGDMCTGCGMIKQSKPVTGTLTD